MATGQSVGWSGHLSGPFIPSVEREALDFQFPACEKWNRSLLRCFGLIGRATYDHEMQRLQQSIVDKTMPIQQAEEASVHLLTYFAPRTTAPSQVPGQVLSSTFITCTPNAPMVCANVGMVRASDVRLPMPDVMQFLPDLPMISQHLYEAIPETLTSFSHVQPSLLQGLTFDDVINHLSKHPVNAEQLRFLLKWFESISGNAQKGASARLLESVVLIQPGDSTPIALSAVKYVVTSRFIPSETFALPAEVLPIAILPIGEAQRHCKLFGWSPVSMYQWIVHLKTLFPSGLENDKDSHEFLATLFRYYGSCTQEEKQACVIAIAKWPCIATTQGVKAPAHAYTRAVTVFPDLPIVTGKIRDTLLQTIGVKDHVNIQDLTEQVIHTQIWDNTRVIRYLMSVETSLGDDDHRSIRNARIFFDNRDQNTKHTLSELFQPTDEHAQLGLLQLAWNDVWRSKDLVFCTRYGLRKRPDYVDLLRMATQLDLNAIAMNYFFKHHAEGYQGADMRAVASFPFVPARTEDNLKLLRPSEVCA